mmetsp:Transcript_17098/g.27672  ORF Transcript_17098/g.27672 Transcript_17098/m.27672 type:complete len:224 (+) Transcript_17098:660-1331(+)
MNDDDVGNLKLLEVSSTLSKGEMILKNLSINLIYSAKFANLCCSSPTSIYNNNNNAHGTANGSCPSADGAAKTDRNEGIMPKKHNTSCKKTKDIAAMAPLVFRLNGPTRGSDRDGVPEVPAAPVDPKTLSERVPVCALSAFIGWLKSTDSPVQEFGISNASLEEMFLAVTKNAAPVAQHNNKASTDCCSCCKKRRPKTSTELDNAIQSTNAIFTLKYTKLELK